MNKDLLERFAIEAYDIAGNIGDLPDGVSIDCAEGVITRRPHHTVIDNDDSISVLAWITIPKDYFDNDPL